MVAGQQYAAGAAPDVHVALPGLFRQLAAEDLLMDLSGLWDEWVAAGDYNDGIAALEAVDRFGSVRTLWCTAASVRIFWCTATEDAIRSAQLPEL